MKLISTTVSGEFVRLRYATDPEPAKAHEWLDFRVRLTAMKNTSGGPDQPIEDRNSNISQNCIEAPFFKRER